MCQCGTNAFQKGQAKSGTLPLEAFLGRPKLENFEVILDTGVTVTYRL